MNAIEGGHGGYDRKADEFSKLFLEQETTEHFQQRGLQGADLQEAVHNRVESLWTIRFEINQRFWQNEVARKPETTTVYEKRLDDRDGQVKLWNEEYQVFLDDMLENTKRYAQESHQPLLFNEAEANTILSLERNLIDGSYKGGLFPVWHPSEGVRYITQMIDKGDTVEVKYTDVGNVRDLTHQEAIAILDKVGKKQDQAYPLFTLEEQDVLSQKIRHLAFHKVAIVDGEIAFRVSQWHTSDDGVLEYRRNQFDDSVVAPIYATGETLKFVGNRLRQNIQETFTPIGTMLAAEMLHKKQEVHDGGLGKSLFEQFQTWKGRVSQKQTVSYKETASSEVGNVSRLFSDYKHIVVLPNVDETPWVKRRKLGDRRKIFFFDRLVKGEFAQQKKTKQNKREIRINSKEQLDPLKPFEPLTQGVIHKEVVKAKKQPQEQLQRVFQRFASKISNIERRRRKQRIKEQAARKEHPIIQEKNLPMKEKEVVAGFSFAVITWLIFVDRIFQKKGEKQEIKKTARLEFFIQKEPTQWILLSIIWYLAMIREQGMKQNIKKNKKKKQYGIVFDRNVSAQIPLHGMIWI